MRVFNLYLPCTCPVFALYLPCTWVAKGFTFQYFQCNNTTPRCMHSLVFVTIFRNSVFLFPNYGTLTKTETAGAALNFFCISSIHFIRFYSALQLPSDCPPTALRVSFRYPLEALFMFGSVIIPHFSVDIRGHSATTFRFL